MPPVASEGFVLPPEPFVTPAEPFMAQPDQTWGLPAPFGNDGDGWE